MTPVDADRYHWHIKVHHKISILENFSEFPQAEVFFFCVKEVSRIRHFGVAPDAKADVPKAAGFLASPDSEHLPANSFIAVVFSRFGTTNGVTAAGTVAELHGVPFSPARRCGTAFRRQRYGNLLISESNPKNIFFASPEKNCFTLLTHSKSQPIIPVFPFSAVRRRPPCTRRAPASSKC